MHPKTLLKSTNNCITFKYQKMKTKSRNYVKPEVLIVQMKMNSLLFTQSTGGAEGQEGGSFGARSARFSDWDESDEEY